MDGRMILAGLALWTVAGAAMASGEDEQWIERYMSQPGRGAQPVAIRSGYRIAWGELTRFIGVPVKVATDSGNHLRGRIERADEREVLLRTHLHGGYADLVLRREQVMHTELE